jgi:hypothetical protein
VCWDRGSIRGRSPKNAAIQSRITAVFGSTNLLRALLTTRCHADVMFARPPSGNEQPAAGLTQIPLSCRLTLVHSRNALFHISMAHRVTTKPYRTAIISIMS